jgi:hypothetical protein
MAKRVKKERTFEVTVRVHLTSHSDGETPTEKDAKAIVAHIVEEAIEGCAYYNGTGLQPTSYYVESFGPRYAVEVK